MYTEPFGEILKWHNIKYLCYADDSKVCVTLKTYGKWKDMLSSVEACTVNIFQQHDENK